MQRNDMNARYKDMVEEKERELADRAERLEDAIYANIDSDSLKKPELSNRAFLTS